MAQAVVEYADFSGGFFVGPRDTAQPMNTWTGDNVWIDRSTGFLMPMQRVARLPSDTYVNNPPQSDLFTFPVRIDTGDLIWAQFDDGSHFRWWDRALVLSDWTVGSISRSAQVVEAPLAISDEVPALGSGVVYIGNGIASLYRGPVPATTALTAIGNRVLRWNDRMVSWVYPGGNRLYYSDAAAFTTWGATNFYDIGDNSAITSVVLAPQALLVGKVSGWWELRGTLGSTVTINPVVIGGGGAHEWAHSLPGGAVVYDGAQNGVTAQSLIGLIPRVFNANPTAADQKVRQPTLSGLLIGTDMTIDPSAGTGRLYGRGWMYDTVNSRWFRYHIDDTTLNPPTGNGITALRWAQDTGDVQDYFTGPDPIYGVINSTGLSRNEVVAFGDLQSQVPPSGQSCTVTLASHKAPVGSQEAVKEVWCEVATGSTVNSGIATVSIRVQAQGVPNAPPDLAMPWSAAYEQEYFSSQLSANSRYMVRFTPSDLPYATEFVPEVTLTNLKLRRLVLVVDRDTLRAS